MSSSGRANGRSRAARLGPADSVDALLESWAGRRPDLDFSPVGIVTRMARVRAHLDAALERVFDAHGLSAANFAVLVTLARIGGDRGVSQRRLMDELGLSSGTVSVRMDFLVELGLVDRRPDPELRRNTLITLTERGRQMFERVAPAHLDNERRVLAALTADEQETLAGLLRKLLVEFEGSAGGRGDAPPLGMTLAPAHAAMALRTSVGLPAVPALLVRSIDDGGAAALAGIRTGDLLVKAGRHRLRSITGLYDALADAAPEGRVRFDVLRGTDEEQVVVVLADGAAAAAPAPAEMIGGSSGNAGEHTI